MKLGELFNKAIGPEVPVEFRAFDGSKGGTSNSDIVVEVKSEDAVSHFMSHPGQVGLARAYVSGDLEITGDLVGAFEALSKARFISMSRGEKLKLASSVAPTAVKRFKFGRSSDGAPEEKKLRGRRHSKGRDAEAIAHHYDVSNEFYRMILGPSMAYTCAVFPESTSSLEVAQEEKFDLVCRKLDLKPGMRILDVGCGWGGMVSHAVENYGVSALGVTLSKQQADWAQARIEDLGLGQAAEVRFLDYRDVTETDFDAISSIGLTEHIGQANYRDYFGFLKGKLKPGARMLNHSITRFNDQQKVMHRTSFVNRYIFPDGELTGPATIVESATAEGLELQHEENLRRHYSLTLNAWRRNLLDNWDAAVADVGERKARVWNLYLAASEYGFKTNIIELHQFLFTNTTSDGFADLELRPDFSRK